VKPASFIYHAPSSKKEALQLLSRFQTEDARLIAGGQSLVPMMAFRLARPGHLIDINRIPGLEEIGVTDDSIVIGARSRHTRFETQIEDGPTGRLLAEVSQAIGHTPIRTRGTFGGSLANADPASEWCMTAVALDARLTAEKPGCQREIAAAEFFQGIMTTALEPDEMLSEIRLPRLPPHARFGFHELSRRKGDFTLAAALAILIVQNGRVSEARLALAGAETHPRRLTAAEDFLVGQAPNEALFAATARAAAAAIDPLTDNEVDVELRRRMVESELLHALRRTGTRPMA
jgi:carbon-monoxide dehydrogenase medium subunit